ncbi:hypothetical protein [Microtetraspora sp. NBRC 16547]|uniref:hypothetical protein n=1 Tax=Microtetraspora sp. NBRC 16547 TaxID=3030993 RepID=UPI0024A185D5|nr:hypothetical protein [Microtetraspora sp. NBRC 16547]GLW96520.1 hypothetical protein Misp02_06070 [Microtetraspora sp. NBRC 16547]
MEPAHAEIEHVWPRDGRIRIVGAVVGMPPAAATLALRNRDRSRTVLRCPATVNGRRFDGSFDIEIVTAATTSARDVWDLHPDLPGQAELRVGRHLDDTADKKRIMTFPAQSHGFSRIRPYSTVKRNLSLICERATT